REPTRKDMMRAIHGVLLIIGDSLQAEDLKSFYNELKAFGNETYSTHLYHEGARSPLKVVPVAQEFKPDSPMLNGYEIINKYFDQLFTENPKVIAFGEDLGKIGDVNQGFAGLQSKHGEHRIFDTGIRELTIMGQGIGLAIRGMRPIAEVQYLDYLVYALQPLTDDAACLHWRTRGKQS
ncbi:MAG: transketolase, partial [Flavitalea sp.]